jgi:sugar phosphate isomerase/epimerase
MRIYPTHSFLLCSLLLGGLTLPAAAASFNGPLGLQLYSLRADFAKDVPGSLKKTREFGFELVELAGTYNLAPEKFKEMLAANGLKPIAGHFPYERYRDDVEGVARDAKALGLKYAGIAWIPHNGPFDEKTCREAIALFNRAGEALARHGIKFFYHQHGYEFAPCGDGTLMDLLIKETDPRHVAFEMDIFWVQFPGQDPARWLEKYGKRWELVHLKDMKKGLKTGDLSGGTDVANDVAIGTGQMDMPAILRAARKAGVKYYFIEDESPSVTEQLPVSLKYLKEVRL